MAINLCCEGLEVWNCIQLLLIANSSLFTSKSVKIGLKGLLITVALLLLTPAHGELSYSNFVLIP